MNVAGLLVLIGTILAGLAFLLGVPRGTRAAGRDYSAYSGSVLALAIVLVGVGVLVGHPHV